MSYGLLNGIEYLIKVVMVVGFRIEISCIFYSQSLWKSPTVSIVSTALGADILEEKG